MQLATVLRVRSPAGAKYFLSQRLMLGVANGANVGLKLRLDLFLLLASTISHLTNLPPVRLSMICRIINELKG